MIHYLEREWGVWYAMGGTGALVDGAGRSSANSGGTIELDADVAEILVEAGARGRARPASGWPTDACSRPTRW